MSGEESLYDLSMAMLLTRPARTDRWDKRLHPPQDVLTGRSEAGQESILLDLFHKWNSNITMNAIQFGICMDYSRNLAYVLTI